MNVLAHHGLESLQLDDQLVGARRQPVVPVDAAGIRDLVLGAANHRFARERHADTRHDAAGIVRDDARDGTRALRIGRTAHEQAEADQH